MAKFKKGDLVRRVPATPSVYEILFASGNRYYRIRNLTTNITYNFDVLDTDKGFIKLTKLEKALK